MYKNKFETMSYNYEFHIIFFDTISSKKEPLMDQSSLLSAGGKHQTSKNRKNKKKKLKQSLKPIK